MDEIEVLFEQLSIESAEIISTYASKNVQLERELDSIYDTLKDNETMEGQLNSLLRVDQIKRTLQINKSREATDLAKVRYLKGLQIIRILYDKTLALDHHFASVSTFREISNISNPNSYASFVSVKEMLQVKPSKKTGFDLTNILGENIYASIIHSFISLFTNKQTSRKEKEDSLAEIECILDFTLRMHSDLNTIYFETVFLQKSNENIMTDLQQLFNDYTKPIQYNQPIAYCKSTDDWSTINELLDKYLGDLYTTIETQPSSGSIRKMQINLQFPIDRLLQFITQYNAFILQGAKFYEKFEIMLNTYENEEQCSSKIPPEYETLKSNIRTAVEKFNTAYKPIEINGSKLKQLLYGINEYQ